MKKNLLLVSLMSLVLLSGCNFINQFLRSDDGESVTPPVNEERARREKQIKREYGEEGGDYQEYREGDIGNGLKAILFFSADGCAECQENEISLKDWYSANYIPLSTYRVDYDSHIELRNRYSVKQANVFVRIDGKGEVISAKQSPSELDILNMLRP